MREYNEYYIAVLDLMDFKGIIQNEECETIARFFDEINQHTVIVNQTGAPLFNTNDINMRVMSDTICFFIDASIKNALAGLISVCDYFQVRMLRFDRPILSRGGIVKDKLYFDKDVVFGPGLVKAYLIEENYDNFPLVIMNKELIENWDNYDKYGADYVKRFTTKEDEKYFSVDYLFLFYGLNHSDTSWKKFEQYVVDNAETHNNASIRAKYQYIKNQFQRITNKYRTFPVD